MDDATVRSRLTGRHPALKAFELEALFDDVQWVDDKLRAQPGSRSAEEALDES